MNVVLLFSGQGAQEIGMGKEFVETYPLYQDLLEKADKILGFSLSQIMLNGTDEELTRTSRCQPALYVMGFGCAEILQQHFKDKINITGCGGLSLGEFTAHSIAGTFDFETGLKLVARRGELMEEACKKMKGAMVAILGGEKKRIEFLARDCDVDVANYNAPGQIVLSGSEEGIEEARKKAKEYGAKLAKPLKVAGAYHSRLMKDAEIAFVDELEKVEIKLPLLPVVSNYLGSQVEKIEDIRHSLAKQVSGSVRWTECIDFFLKRGKNSFIECGPKGILKGLLQKISPEAKGFLFEKPEDLHKVKPL